MNQKITGLLTFNETCEFMAISRSTLNKRVKSDPTFPQPIKMGKTRQAKAYFKYQEIVNHIDALTSTAGGV